MSDSLNLPPNYSCVLLRKKVISVEPTPHPELKDDNVLVKVMVTGICGSDLHNYLHGGVGGRPVVEPLVMGHESAGEVIAVGKNVKTHKVGDRVAVEPGLPCRKCVFCKQGRSNLCTDQLYCGAPGSVGSLMQYFSLPSDMAPKIPESVSWDEAGCIQPLAIGIQIGKRVDLRPHQTVCIFGCGPIGLISAAVAHAYSARMVVAFDISESRVKFAKAYISPITGKPIIEHVFLNTVLPSTPIDAPAAKGHSHGNDPTPAGVADGEIDDHDEHELPEGDRKWAHAQLRIEEILKQVGLEEEGGFDRVIEATGAGDCMLLGVAAVKQGGVYLAVGLSHIQTNWFPNIAVTNKELDIRGITRYTPGTFQSAIDLLARKVVDVKQLITAEYPLSRSQDAFEAVAARNDIKVLVRNQQM